jgi:hypothetical protein
MNGIGCVQPTLMALAKAIITPLMVITSGLMRKEVMFNIVKNLRSKYIDVIVEEGCAVYVDLLNWPRKFNRRRPHKGEKNNESLNPKGNYIVRDNMITQTEQMSLAKRIIRAVQAWESEGCDRDLVHDVPLRAFGVEVSAIRHRKGLSWEDIAEQYDIDVDVLVAIEFGLVPLRRVRENLPVLAEVLDESPENLSRLLDDFVFDK